MMIKNRAVLDRFDLPENYREMLDNYVRQFKEVSNNSYFILNVAEYWAYMVEEPGAYIEDFGVALYSFMRWFSKQTSEDEVLVLYWW
jgi:hypothetical protein